MALTLTFIAAAIALFEIGAALVVLGHRRWFFPRVIRPRLDPDWCPPCAIIVPTKGAFPALAANLGSLLALDYPDYEVLYVVEDESDAGVPVIREVVARSAGRARLIVAGLATRCSQQNHNMIAGVAAARGAEVLAFCDNDITPARDWLRALVLPLSGRGVAVATGYRWVVPARGTLAEHAHAFVNMTMFAHFALFACLLGRGLWGGSFALRRADYEAWGVAARWSETISDDLSLSAILQARGRRTLLTPEVLVVTDDTLPTVSATTAWYSRQLLNVKAYEPLTWLLAGAPLLLAGLLIATLPLAAVAAALGGSFVAWGGVAGLIFWSGEIVTASLYAALGPTRRHGLLLARLPWLRLAQVAAFLQSVGRDAIIWAGVRYRFDRQGRVISLERAAQPSPTPVRASFTAAPAATP